MRRMSHLSTPGEIRILAVWRVKIAQSHVAELVAEVYDRSNDRAVIRYSGPAPDRSAAFILSGVPRHSAGIGLPSHFESAHSCICEGCVPDSTTMQ